MRRLDAGLIYDAATAPPAERIAFFTHLCRAGGGALYAACQLGSHKHAADSTVRLFRGDPAGQHWTMLPARFSSTLDGVPGSLAGPALLATTEGELLLFVTWFDRSEPQRPLFDPVTEGILHSKLLMARSADRGDHWSQWQEIPTPGLTGCATTGPVLRLEDGRLLFPFESFKEYDDPNPGRHGAWLMMADGDQRFGAPLLVAQHPEHRVYYWDQRLCRGAGKREVLALFWTHDLHQKKDLDVHFQAITVTSTGLVRSSVRGTGIQGQIAAPLQLANGDLLAFVVDRERPATMTLWISHDAGSTWPEDEKLVVYRHEEAAFLSQGRENIDFKAYWEDMGKWTFGHPAVVELSSHHVLVAWYAGTPDSMSIHWARIATCEAQNEAAI